MKLSFKRPRGVSIPSKKLWFLSLQVLQKSREVQPRIQNADSVSIAVLGRDQEKSLQCRNRVPYRSKNAIRLTQKPFQYGCFLTDRPHFESMTIMAFFFFTFLSKKPSQARRWFLIDLEATQDMPNQLNARSQRALVKRQWSTKYFVDLKFSLHIKYLFTRIFPLFENCQASICSNTLLPKQKKKSLEGPKTSNWAYKGIPHHKEYGGMENSIVRASNNKIWLKRPL